MDENKLNNQGRRDFLRKLAILPVAGVCLQAGEAEASRREYVKLIDTTKCIGCHRCTSACDRWNDLPAERTRVLTGKTFTVVNYRRLKSNGEAGVHVKWQCQHCRKPACARVCPVNAISKLPEGPVVVVEDKCIGCRYCYQACPFSVPELDFDERVTRKCHLCYNRFTGLEYRGKRYGGRAQPACVSNCPAGALDFGERSDMLKKAKARTKEVNGYLYGLSEAGGTGVLTILPAEPEELGMIAAPKKKLLDNMDSFRITMTGIAFAATMSGLMYFYSIMTESEDDDDEQEHK